MNVLHTITTIHFSVSTHAGPSCNDSMAKKYGHSVLNQPTPLRLFYHRVFGGAVAVLCCAVLCCAVLCCAVLCCAVPCRAVPCRAVPCCAMLCCAVLCCAVERRTLDLLQFHSPHFARVFRRRHKKPLVSSIWQGE